LEINPILKKKEGFLTHGGGASAISKAGKAGVRLDVLINNQPFRKKSALRLNDKKPS